MIYSFFFLEDLAFLFNKDRLIWCCIGQLISICTRKSKGYRNWWQPTKWVKFSMRCCYRTQLALPTSASSAVWVSRSTELCVLLSLPLLFLLLLLLIGGVSCCCCCCCRCRRCCWRSVVGVVRQRHLEATPPKRLEFSLNSAFKRSRTQNPKH